MGYILAEGMRGLDPRGIPWHHGMDAWNIYPLEEAHLTRVMLRKLSELIIGTWRDSRSYRWCLLGLLGLGCLSGVIALLSPLIMKVAMDLLVAAAWKPFLTACSAILGILLAQSLVGFASSLLSANATQAMIRLLRERCFLNLYQAALSGTHDIGETLSTIRRRSPGPSGYTESLRRVVEQWRQRHPSAALFFLEVSGGGVLVDTRRRSRALYLGPKSLEIASIARFSNLREQIA